MKRFIALNVSRLRYDDLAGLASETLVVASRRREALGPVATAVFAVLEAASANFRQWLNVSRASALTPQIADADKLRDTRFTEIKRIVKANEKSSVPAMAAAATKLMALLRPIWDISSESLMSQTVQLTIFIDRVGADPAASAAINTLGLATMLADLTQANTDLKALYNERLDERSVLAGHSATNESAALVSAYDDFCVAVEITLTALPTDALQTVFNEMNDLRRNYIQHLPKDLGAGEHTVVEPIDTQAYTEKPVTVVPRVYYREDDKPTVELSLGKDFAVTYKNNTNVGTAELTIHGKGAYKGQKTVTFNIARAV
jgi:hypothetical protein